MEMYFSNLKVAFSFVGNAFSGIGSIYRVDLKYVIWDAWEDEWQVDGISNVMNSIVSEKKKNGLSDTKGYHT